MKVEVVDAEAYRYDGEVISKAKALGKEGLVSITPRQVSSSTLPGHGQFHISCCRLTCSFQYGDLWLPSLMTAGCLLMGHGSNSTFL